jgi:hypothetical protein
MRVKWEDRIVAFLASDGGVLPTPGMWLLVGQLVGIVRSVAPSEVRALVTGKSALQLLLWSRGCVRRLR